MLNEVYNSIHDYDDNSCDDCSSKENIKVCMNERSTPIL